MHFTCLRKRQLEEPGLGVAAAVPGGTYVHNVPACQCQPRMMEMEVCPDETQEHCDSSSTKNHCQAANSWNTTQLKSIHKHSKNESSCWVAQHGALKRS